MNAVEIEEAVSALSVQPFDVEEFPYDFLTAFGNKDAAIKRLRAGATNRSDIGGVCQANNIHIATCASGQVTETLGRLRASPATAKAKAKFILATDGETIEAEDLITGELVATPYRDLSNHFGLFLPLAGITTVKQIRESTFDIKATGRLNRLYIELLKDNADWASAARRPEMNHFMARLIFCFFAEDTGIFRSEGLFTVTIDQMSARDSSNTHDIIGEIFRAMNTAIPDRAASGLRPWGDVFPYVNGGLFSGSTDCPRFSKIARSYLIAIGSLDWKRINPDIFGSMIQAVADDEERGALGMHYTSVPNILKVLNPLFLDDLRAQLAEAGDNPRKLLNLRNRMAKIRVFDPACGSGNFLVIAYKEIRAIEAEINQRRGEATLETAIPLTNFRGIELRDFPAEIARLALIIAEFQCDVMYRGEQEARLVFLPLDSQNWITQGNALRLDWLSICPPTGTGVKLKGEDLFSGVGERAQIDFQNEGGETYICGNPPYLGKGKVTAEQRSEMGTVLGPHIKNFGYVDYVACWIFKAAVFLQSNSDIAAFVTTNSVCQGRQAPLIWSAIMKLGLRMEFANTNFYWSNSAARNAAVVCVIVSVTRDTSRQAYLFTGGERMAVGSISAYLTPNFDGFVEPRSLPLSENLGDMKLGC